MSASYCKSLYHIRLIPMSPPRFSLIVVTVVMLAGCIICPRQYSETCFATGVITGEVIHSRGSAVEGAQVQGVYVRGWTTLIPPVPNEFVVATARTDARGQFKLITTKRVDRLTVSTNDPRECGTLDRVMQKGNVIRIK
jgi:hypothetical protein